MDRPVKYPQWVSHLTDPMDRNSVHQGAWALEDKGLHGPRCWNNNLENLHSIMVSQCSLNMENTSLLLMVFHPFTVFLSNAKEIKRTKIIEKNKKTHIKM